MHLKKDIVYIVVNPRTGQMVTTRGHQSGFAASVPPYVAATKWFNSPAAARRHAPSGFTVMGIPYTAAIWQREAALA